MGCLYPAAILGADYKFNQNQDVVIAGYGTPYGYGQNTDAVLRKKTVSFGSHHQAHEVMLNQYSGGPAFVERDGQLYFFGVASRVSSNGNGESCRGISIYLNVNQMRESINDYIRQLHGIFGTPVSVQL